MRSVEPPHMGFKKKRIETDFALTFISSRLKKTGFRQILIWFSIENTKQTAAKICYRGTIKETNRVRVAMELKSRRICFYAVLFFHLQIRAGIFLFDGPGGAMGIDFFWGALGLIFRASVRKKKSLVFFWCFLGVFFLCFCCFLGVFVLFWCFFCFSRAARNFFWLLFSAVTFFSRGAVRKT